MGKRIKWLFSIAEIRINPTMLAFASIALSGFALYVVLRVIDKL